MLDTPWMNYLREFNVVSVLVRLTLSVVLSGVVGFERELKGQPAGLRTHMLVCLGAALAILSNLFVAQTFNLTDPTRIAAQVISGIGFLGAGAIVVTGRHERRVRGLTTAAGLWSSACMGIAIGSGFYEGALVAFALIMVIIAVLHNLDARIHDYTSERVIQIYAEFVDLSSMMEFIRTLRRLQCHINSTEMDTKNVNGGAGRSAFFVVKFPTKSISTDVLIERAQEVDGVLFVESI